MHIPTDQELFESAQSLGDKLRRTNKFLATAESCTGGWVGKVITDVPGSSHWYDRGFITYTNESKRELLGVPDEIIRRYGAVSEQTAQAMVVGVLQHSAADVALSITGIAGPGGGSETKPVGFVWFGWGQRHGNVQTQSYTFLGDREAIRRQAVWHTLLVLQDYFLE